MFCRGDARKSAVSGMGVVGTFLEFVSWALLCRGCVRKLAVWGMGVASGQRRRTKTLFASSDEVPDCIRYPFSFWGERMVSDSSCRSRIDPRQAGHSCTNPLLVSAQLAICTLEQAVLSQSAFSVGLSAEANANTCLVTACIRAWQGELGEAKKDCKR